MSPEHISIREFIYPPTYSENNVQTVFLFPSTLSLPFPTTSDPHYIIYSQNLSVDLLLLGAIMNVSWFMGRPPANVSIVMSIIHIPFACTHKTRIYKLAGGCRELKKINIKCSILTIHWTEFTIMVHLYRIEL